MASGKRLTKTLVERLPERSAAWDSDVRGFGARRQARDVFFVLKYRAGPIQRTYTIGRFGAPWTVETARKEAQRVRGEIAKGTDPALIRARLKATPTLRQFATRYLQEVSGVRKKASTAREDRRLLDLHILPALGDRKVADITRSDAARFHHGLRDTPVSANRALSLLSHILNTAVTVGERPEGPNPCAGVKKFPEQRRERFLTEAELARLGAAIDEAETIGVPWTPDPGKKVKHAPREENRRTKIGPHAAAALRLLLFTGARLREVLHLRWEWVDFERGMLFLPDSKTGAKTIVLNAPALAVLQSLPRVGPYVIAGEAMDKPRADLKRPWSLVRERAGLSGVRLHDLRHTYASFGASGGLGLPIIGKLLGHSHAATTARYAHLDNDPVKRAAEAIGARIAGALSGGTGAQVVSLRSEHAA